MDSEGSFEDGWITIGRIIVEEDRLSAHGDSVQFRPRPVTLEREIPTGERDTESMTAGDDDAGGPDLDVELHDFTGRQSDLVIMRVNRPIRCRRGCVDCAMGCPQPPYGDHSSRIERASQCDVATLIIENTHRHEDVDV